VRVDLPVLAVFKRHLAGGLFLNATTVVRCPQVRCKKSEPKKLGARLIIYAE
jgi:hypothetical protein